MGKKLWIYGDSLSTDYTRVVANIEVKTWYEYLSDKLGLQIKNHAKNGHGIMTVVTEILTTHQQWNSDDVIIVGFPDFFRISIPQVDNTITISDLQNDRGNKLTQINKDIQENGSEWVDNNSKNIWNGLASTLTHKNINTFFVHKKEGVTSFNLLHDGDVIDWILETHSYITPNDKHFSPKGAEDFFNYILPKINYNG
jgi:hypothetical protein